MNTRKLKQNKWTAPKKTFYVFFFVFIILFLQFAYLSLSKTIYGKNMSLFASNRNTVKTTIKASRGSIFDINGDALAINVSSYTLIAYLNENVKDINGVANYVKDITATASSLATILNTDSEYIKNILQTGKDNNKYQVEFGSIGKGITELTKNEIEKLNMPGIDFVESQKRFYPNGDFASYIIGYAKYLNSEDINSELVGELGIESKYNELLKGTDGYLEYQQDKYGYKIVGTKEIYDEATDGYNIYLTLDASIQRFIESAMDTLEATYSPEWATINIMDATTGDILGSGSSPSYDPNLRNITNYENPLVSLVYEPGSTMKIYTYMCAIENNKYDGNAKFTSGSITVYDKTVNDWVPAGWGYITYDKGFEYSSNVGVTNLILNNNITNAELRECLEKYGFGSKTGVELSREMAGSIDFKYKIELVNAGFGQGITTTAVQQLQAATLIANNGVIVKPHIVEKIINPDTNEIYYESKTETSEQLVKTSTIKKLKELMYNTIHGTDAGTAAKLYNIDGFDLIGKTGTAQIYSPVTKSYLSGGCNYVYSFVGMYPYENPQIIVYAAMKKPKFGASYGLSLAVKDVLRNVAKYKDIYSSDEKDDEAKTYILESYLNKNTETVANKLQEQGASVVILGNGSKIVDQYPSSKTEIIKGDKVILQTNSTELTMPSILGWSKNDIIQLCKLLNIAYTFNGYGFATSQNIKIGDIISIDSILDVTLATSISKE